MKIRSTVKICCLWLLISLLINHKLKAQQTFNINGEVRDEVNGYVPGATVFIINTTIATATDVDGTFHLKNIKPGNYEVMVKLIGYEPFLKKITIADRNISLKIQLVPNPRQLKQVVIKPDEEWFNNLAMFKAHFLGETENAANCTIANPEVIFFDLDKKSNILRASASDFLTIKNKGLGYTLKYLLTGFEYNVSTNSVIYQGYPYFEEMKGTPEDSAKWKKNREIAYQGSVRHFIRSLYTNTASADGFIIYKIKNRRPLGERIDHKKPFKLIFHQVDLDTLLAAKDNHFKTLNYKDALFVIFTKEGEPDSFRDKNYSMGSMFRSLPYGQISIVNLKQPAIIDDQGHFEPTQSLFFEGYMAWENIADLVPFDYISNKKGAKNYDVPSPNR
jgi:hypothetical protein